jgi:hypothetical protein
VVDAAGGRGGRRVAGFGVYRFHGAFGSHNNTSTDAVVANDIVPFNPKHIRLGVFGDPGAVATINYLDIDVQPQQVLDASLVTSAGLVFATIMSVFIVSGLRVLGQIGTTIGLGLLFDMLIVRSFITPPIATLLGRWFWWPQQGRPRPASQMLRPYGPRPAVRQLLLWGDEDTAVTSESPSHSG